MMRLLVQRYNDIGFRLAFAVWMLYIPLIGVSQPFSMPYMALYFDSAGSLPIFCMCMLAALFIFTDVATNGLQKSESCVPIKPFAWMRQQRTTVYGIGAFCALSIPYVVLRGTGQNEAGTFFYLLIFTNGVWLMVTDAIGKYRKSCAPAR